LVWLDKVETGAPGPPAKFKVNRAQLMVGVCWGKVETGDPGPPAMFKVNRAQLMVGFGWIR
jgi:hypothetical protein